MDRPFLSTSISFVLGIIITYYLKITLTYLFLVFFILAFIFIINLLKDKFNSISFILLIISLGAIITSYNLNASKLSQYLDKNIKVSGVVDEISWKDDEKSKYIVKVNEIIYNDKTIVIDEKTVLKVNGSRKLDLGDYLVFNCKVSKPMENTNPKLYNYKLNLLSNKIYTSLNIKDYNIISIDNCNRGKKHKLRISFRNMVEELFDKNLESDSSNLMKGIILGNKSYLEDEDISLYRDLGLAHILAVSGLHIGIIAGFLIFILSRLTIKKKHNIFIVLGLIWFYAFLIGFPPSVLRASIMFTFLLIGETLAEPYDSINILFLSFFILLISNPLLIFNLGFQLSYIATFSIIFFSPYINEFFYPHNNKLTFTIASLFGVYAGILPVQLYYFNNFPIIGILSNLFIAPIISLALILGQTMIVFQLFLPFLNNFLGHILNFLLSIENSLIDFLNIIGIGSMELASPSFNDFILYYIIIFTIFKIVDFNKSKQAIKKLIFLYSLLFILTSYFHSTFDKSLEIDFIDVGQGDCILLKTNKSSYMIDTGGNEFLTYDIGKNIVLPYLKKHGINKLDAVFITHFHSDHCKSLPLLIENMEIKNILISYENPESEVYQYIENGDIAIKILSKGDIIYLDNDMKMEVVSPRKDFISKGFSENDLSLVLNLSCFGNNILFTGDIENPVEKILTEEIKENISILKVPHHGSKTSSTDEFLKVLKAQAAIISVGRNNMYGHPNDEVIDRYRDFNTKVYRTDQMGMIRVKIDKKGFEIIPFVNEIEFIEILNKYLLEVIYIIFYYLISYIMIRIYTFRERTLEKYEL